METDTGPTQRKTPLGLKILVVLGALVVVPGGAFLAAASIPTGGKVAIGVAVAWWLVASAVLGKTLLKRRPDIRTPVRATLAVAAVASLAAAFVVTRGSTVDEQIVTAKSAEPADAAERDSALAGSGGSRTDQSEPRKQQGSGASAKASGSAPKKGSDGGARNPSEPGGAPPPADGARVGAPSAEDAGAPKAPREAPAAPAENTRLLSGSFSGESGHRGQGNAAVVDLVEGGRMLTFSAFDVDPGAGNLRVYLHAGKTRSDKLGDFVEIARLKGTKGDQQYEIPDDLDLRRYSNVVIWCVPFSTRIAQAPLN